MQLPTLQAEQPSYTHSRHGSPSRRVYTLADRWLQAIPTTAPFLGSLVQCETKKGKWTKRWLETRGGQIFLAKNEKVSRVRHTTVVG
jgi:hypothetical protein